VKRIYTFGYLALLIVLWPVIASSQTTGLSGPSLPGPANVGALPAPPAFRIALPDEYRLGPGDLVDVVIAGRVEVVRHTIVVSPEVKIHSPPVGGIPVGGLTVAEAREAISQKLSTVLRFVDVTLSVVQARAFEVLVTGEVVKPGSYQVTALDRLSQVLASAGGVSPRGSTRRVALLVKGRPDRTVDLLKYMFQGDVKENPTLAEGTTVYVPPKSDVVMLQGHVQRPGEYELTTDRSVRGVLNLAGGPLPSAALKNARFTRIGSDKRKETTSIDLEPIVSARVTKELQHGDAIYIPSDAIFQDVVQVRGAVIGSGPQAIDLAKVDLGRHPLSEGRYELAAGERVRDLLVKAGGPAPWADLRRAFIERTESPGTRTSIPVDLDRLLVKKDESVNLELKNGDLLVVPALEDKVYVSGRVKTPGAYEFKPYLAPKDYLLVAGGPDDRAKVAAAVVIKRDGKEYPLDQSPAIEPGDIVQVPDVKVKWWQDYLQIAQGIASIVLGYASILLLAK
jgi:protein involved in polysaccharide export with SLBB domain